MCSGKGRELDKEKRRPLHAELGPTHSRLRASVYAGRSCDDVKRRGPQEGGNESLNALDSTLVKIQIEIRGT